MRHCITPSVVILGCLFVACAQERRAPFSVRRFTEPTETTLAFDLEQRPPVAGLLIRNDGSGPTTLHTVVLPFGISSPNIDPDVASTTGDFRTYCVLTYITDPSNLGVHAVGFCPDLGEPPKEYFYRESLPGDIYFLSDGLKRRFVYKVRRNISSYNRVLGRITTEHPNRVVVRLPPRVEVFETAPSSLAAALITHQGEAVIRHYATAIPAASQASQTIDLSYQVPPTQEQIERAKQFGKFFGEFLVPLLEAIFLTSAKGKDRRFRRVVILLAITVQAAILIALLWWAFHVRGVVGDDALWELGFATLSALLTFAVTRLQDRSAVEATKST